jgi:iron-sulfur cluster repair protein YtfE (RIC family)
VGLEDNPMLNQIKLSKPPDQEEDAVDLLIACHTRIRHFTEAAVKLAHAQAASPDQIHMTAAGIYRYFAVSLPLHEADEEDSLRPRLDPIADERVRHALLAMHDQHMAIDELVERLQPLLLLIEPNPAVLQSAGGEMCSITKALQEIFDAHLKLEEQVIFPAIRAVLGEKERATMLSEMRLRRQQV